MSEVAIRARGLGKCYRLGMMRSIDRQLKEVITDRIRELVRGRNMQAESESARKPSCDEFWALRGVDFNLAHGEVLGIVGCNGAGKSTLLKILARITDPSEGEARIFGRVGSLLEVGTGFHPELTGRENVYLNGAIMGMSREEIRRKFDEILEFSGVSRFVDTPVKRYSSGMMVRLAFAVAAHLEPEVLIVDEVLAVGDAEFQKKCLRKMEDVKGHGRTILFVSHNMAAVRQLCSRAIWLERGGVVDAGDPAEVVSRYLSGQNRDVDAGEADLTNWPLRRGNGEARFLRARLLNEEGNLSTTFYRMERMQIEFSFASSAHREVALDAICVTRDEGIKVLQLSQYDSPNFACAVVDGVITIHIDIAKLPLQCGEYAWIFSIRTAARTPLDIVEEVLPFHVEDDLSRSPRPFVSRKAQGLCSLIADWQLLSNEESSESDSGSGVAGILSVSN